MCRNNPLPAARQTAKDQTEKQNRLHVPRRLPDQMRVRLGGGGFIQKRLAGRRRHWRRNCKTGDHRRHIHGGAARANAERRAIIARLILMASIIMPGLGAGLTGHPGRRILAGKARKQPDVKCQYDQRKSHAAKLRGEVVQQVGKNKIGGGRGRIKCSLSLWYSQLHRLS